MQYKVTAPLVVPISKKKNYSINLNMYRNAHYLVNNKAKIQYALEMEPQLLALPEFNKITIEYFLYPKTHRDLDVTNLGSIQSKFFDDALVGCGKIKDDNYHYIPSETVTFGEVDKENPRVEIVITEV